MKSISDTKAKLILFMGFMVFSALAGAQNYNEAKVPDYELPQLFSHDNATIKAWEAERRSELIRLFESNVYGKTPSTSLKIHKEIRAFPFVVSGIEAIHKEIDLHFIGPNNEDTATIALMLILPLKEQVPVFLGINRAGNHTIHSSQHITIRDNWVSNKAEYNIFNHTAGPSTRGVDASRWPIERILQRGYGLATFNASPVFPDKTDGRDASILRLFNDYNPEKGAAAGALGMWAWGLSRAMDHLMTEPRIDQDRVAVIGHSRRGKAALWAGAQDTRFAAVISNNSGCGGAALSRRAYGETIKRINTQFPHWFCANFKNYNDNEASLPVDQHMLLALVAPRLLYVASANDDQWADPRGEFLSAYHASEAYELYNMKGIAHDRFPEVNSPLSEGNVGYHIRNGGHDLSRYDWERYMDFLDKHFR